MAQGLTAGARHLSRRPPQVTGVVSDGHGKAHYVLSGSWDERMECAKVVQSSPGSPGLEGRQKTVYQTLPAKLLWKKYPLP